MNLDELIYKLKLNREDFYFQIDSHPDYPSARSLSDTLDFFRIQNEGYEIVNNDIWEEVSEKFIVSITHEGVNKFSLVERKNNTYNLFSDKKFQYSESEFLKNVGNFILLLDNELHENKIIISNKIVFYLMLTLLLLFNIPLHSLLENIFNIISFTGVILSNELFLKRFGNSSKIVSNICNYKSSSTNTSSCDKVMSKSFIFLGLEIQDFSYIYFLSIFFIGTMIEFPDIPISILSWLSLIAIIYSLYIQVFITKSYCKICLTIVIILTALFTISYNKAHYIMDCQSLLLSILSGAIIMISILTIKKFIQHYQDTNKINLINQKFKRTYRIFKQELENSRTVNFSTEPKIFFLGNNNSKIHISVVLSTYCGFCGETYEIIQKLIDLNKNISIDLRFNFRINNSEEKQKQLISTLYQIYLRNQQEFLNALKIWYSHKNYKLFLKQFGTSEINEKLLYNLQIQSLENEGNLLNFTPIILINNKLFPQLYERSDILYFIQDLLEED